MRLVVIEHPFAGEVAANVAYAKRCMLDSLHRGEAPFASALLYAHPGILDDLRPAERSLGIEAGLAWGNMADAVAFYVDRGVSRGMMYGYRVASKRGSTIEVRTIDRELTPQDLESLKKLAEES